jgi:DNA-binding NarL/FixJ family response regulator
MSGPASAVTVGPMTKTLLCACGRAVTGATGEDLLTEVEAHLTRDHRELLAAHAAANVAQLHDEASGGGSYGRRMEPRRRLTATEEHVARLVAEGLSTPDVARLLGVSAKTIETHLFRVYRKLGINSRRELAHSPTAFFADARSPRPRDVER